MDDSIRLSETLCTDILSCKFHITPRIHCSSKSVKPSNSIAHYHTTSLTTYLEILPLKSSLYKRTSHTFVLFSVTRHNNCPPFGINNVHMAPSLLAPRPPAVWTGAGHHLVRPTSSPSPSSSRAAPRRCRRCVRRRTRRSRGHPRSLRRASAGSAASSRRA
jgi:hypothetical protein